MWERLGAWTLTALLLGLGGPKVSGKSVYVWGGGVTEEYCLQNSDLRPHHPAPTITCTRPPTQRPLHPAPAPAGSASAGAILPPAACAGWGRVGMNLRSLGRAESLSPHPGPTAPSREILSTSLASPGAQALNAVVSLELPAHSVRHGAQSP